MIIELICGENSKAQAEKHLEMANCSFGKSKLPVQNSQIDTLVVKPCVGLVDFISCSQIFQCLVSLENKRKKHERKLIENLEIQSFDFKIRVPVMFTCVHPCHCNFMYLAG